MGIPLIEGEVDYTPDATFEPGKILRMGEGVAVAQLGDDAVLDVQFFEKRIPIPSKSTSESLHFEKRDYVRIARPGDKSTVVVRPARDADKRRFPYQWQGYKSGKSQSIGTPIERLYELGLLQNAQVEMLKVSGVKTIEQTAAATPAIVTGWGSDGAIIQKYARGFLAQKQEAEQKADTEQLKVDLASEREARAKLEDRLAQLEGKGKPASKTRSKKKAEEPIEEPIEEPLEV